MKRLLATAALVLATAVGAASAASAASYDIDSTKAAGVSDTFAAGAYQITFTGGAYDAFSYFSNDDGTYNHGWTDALAVTIGGNTTNYYLGDSGGNELFYGTQAEALAAYQSAPSFFASLNNGTATTVSGPLTFSVGSATSVTFSNLDSYNADNRGGVSISVAPAVSAAPEPGAWALMFAGVGLAGVALRRRKEQAAATYGV